MPASSDTAPVKRLEGGRHRLARNRSRIDFPPSAARHILSHCVVLVPGPHIKSDSDYAGTRSELSGGLVETVTKTEP